MTEIIKVVVNNREKAIEVKDGRILILCGHGASDGAFWKNLEECSDADFEAAKEAEVEEDTSDAETDDHEYKSSFEGAVDLLAYMRGEQFLELVRYARGHGNSFRGCGRHEEQLAAVVNADDCYCTAIIKLTRHFGDAVERKAFMLFEQAENGYEQEFLDFWSSLQIINSLL